MNQYNQLGKSPNTLFYIDRDNDIIRIFHNNPSLVCDTYLLDYVNFYMSRYNFKNYKKVVVHYANHISVYRNEVRDDKEVFSNYITQYHKKINNRNLLYKKRKSKYGKC